MAKRGGYVTVNGVLKPYEYLAYPGWFDGKIYNTEEEYLKDHPVKEVKEPPKKKSIKHTIED